MFRHVVMFKWADGVDGGHVAAAADGFNKLADVIPEIQSYRHGADLGLSEQNYDYVVVGDFASADDYIVYRDHPVHQQFIADMIMGNISERAAIQYEISG